MWVSNARGQIGLRAVATIRKVHPRLGVSSAGEGFSVGEGGLDWTTRYRHLWSGGSWPQARARIRWTESEFRTVTTVTLEPWRQWLWDRDDNDFGTMTTVTLEPWRQWLWNRYDGDFGTMTTAIVKFPSIIRRPMRSFVDSSWRFEAEV